jgi:hypothetical protein
MAAEAAVESERRNHMPKPAAWAPTAGHTAGILLVRTTPAQRATSKGGTQNRRHVRQHHGRQPNLASTRSCHAIPANARDVCGKIQAHRLTGAGAGRDRKGKGKQSSNIVKTKAKLII